MKKTKNIITLFFVFLLIISLVLAQPTEPQPGATDQETTQNTEEAFKQQPTAENFVNIVPETRKLKYWKDLPPAEKKKYLASTDTDFKKSPDKQLAEDFFSDFNNINNNPRIYENYAKSQGITITINGNVQGYANGRLLTKNFKQGLNLEDGKDDFDFLVDEEGNLVLYPRYKGGTLEDGSRGQAILIESDSEVSIYHGHNLFIPEGRINGIQITNGQVMVMADGRISGGADGFHGVVFDRNAIFSYFPKGKVVWLAEDTLITNPEQLHDVRLSGKNIRFADGSRIVSSKSSFGLKGYIHIHNPNLIEVSGPVVFRTKYKEQVEIRPYYASMLIIHGENFNPEDYSDKNYLYSSKDRLFAHTLSSERAFQNIIDIEILPGHRLFNTFKRTYERQHHITYLQTVDLTEEEEQRQEQLMQIAVNMLSEDNREAYQRLSSGIEGNIASLRSSVSANGGFSQTDIVGLASLRFSQSMLYDLRKEALSLLTPEERQEWELLNEKDESSAPLDEPTRIEAEDLERRYTLESITREEFIAALDNIGVIIDDEKDQLTPNGIVADEKDKLTISVHDGDSLEVVSRADEGKVPLVRHHTSPIGRTHIKNGRHVLSYDTDHPSGGGPGLYWDMKSMTMNYDNPNEGWRELEGVKSKPYQSVAMRIESDIGDTPVTIVDSGNHISSSDGRLNINSLGDFTVSESIEDNMVQTPEDLEYRHGVGVSLASVPQLNMPAPDHVTPNLIQIVDRWLVKNERTPNKFKEWLTKRGKNYDDLDGMELLLLEAEFMPVKSFEVSSKYNAFASRNNNGHMGLGELIFDPYYYQKMPVRQNIAVQDTLIHEYDHTQNHYLVLADAFQRRVLAKGVTSYLNTLPEETRQSAAEQFRPYLRGELRSSQQIVDDMVLSTTEPKFRSEEFLQRVIALSESITAITENPALSSSKSTADMRLNQMLLAYSLNEYYLQHDLEQNAKDVMQGVPTLDAQNIELEELRRLVEEGTLPQDQLLSKARKIMKLTREMSNLRQKHGALMNGEPAQTVRAVAITLDNLLWQSRYYAGLPPDSRDRTKEVVELFRNGFPTTYAFMNYEFGEGGMGDYTVRSLLYAQSPEETGTFEEVTTTYVEPGRESIRSRATQTTNPEERKTARILTQLAYDEGKIGFEEYKYRMGITGDKPEDYKYLIKTLHNLEFKDGQFVSKHTPRFQMTKDGELVARVAP